MLVVLDPYIVYLVTVGRDYVGMKVDLVTRFFLIKK